MKILNGRLLLEKIKKELALETALLIKKNNQPPHLVAILIGTNPASQTYVNAKVKACRDIGFKSTVVNYPDNVSQDLLISKIKDLNMDEKVNGLIVQLPLPDHINESLIIHSISHKKDVDGFHPINIGRMVLGLPCYLPATPFGILSLLNEYDIDTHGKKCLVIGRSNIVGTPVSILMSRNKKVGNATVTLAHSKTRNINSLTKDADIIILALGVPGYLKSNMIKKHTVIIDVGIHRVKSDKTKSGFKLVGDADFDDIKDKTSFITPVPGGVGPMTIASLLQNTLYSAKKVIY
ncbi:bifunctional 5,10-methylene-tetrahydrofolate dehydrogenase/5,10-methylene-tetrahydrofolate cyclohydrolase [Flavobacteriales bacterium]|nr:bifunctional 5,10-methylene-tetrahydrofolate dehydrogenase/5,10-methylene-tetrahydrofolate cyclohydrolase [Flavobacteriales bacterium]